MKENHILKNFQTHSGLFLKGSIFFDSEGKEILRNINGNSYFMDNKIKALWKSIETTLSRPGYLISNLDELFKSLPPDQKTQESKNLLKKFIELDLIGVN